MTEFFYNLMHPLPNAVMSVVIGILLLYWLFAFFSGAGMEDLDVGFDFDADVDIDIDIDADIDVDVDADGGITHLGDDLSAEGASPGIFFQFLHFFNLGRIPFMFLFTVFNFFVWAGSLITTKLFDVSVWGVWSILILLPLGIVALFLTKIATNPLVKFFKEIGYKGEKEIDFFGRGGIMLSTIHEQKRGTAEFIIDKNPIKLTVISYDGKELKYGEQVIIADESDDRKIFYVIKK